MDPGDGVRKRKYLISFLVWVLVLLLIVLATVLFWRFRNGFGFALSIVVLFVACVTGLEEFSR